ncbi:unnamed protein product [Cladocopium goreaui]|uniref:Uncharacterized protein n=1 Tax=Cladocopium goreaui TaxID=2562237 RepID=A0A9P1G412_9DINO|nr:unnamed protein product [Cladocopium goreaui]
MVGELQRDVAACVELVYSMRHGVQQKVEPDDFGGAASINSNPNLPAPLDESGKFAFPLCDGGTFMQIAQRAMKTDWTQAESANLCHAAGFLEADDITLLKSQFMTVTEWPPEPGSIFNTSIFAWSYEDASFWRGKSVSCAEVVSYAKSMALTRFREGEMVAARFDSWPPENMKLAADGSIFGLLQFGDGSQKLLAAIITWICLLLTWKAHGHDAVKQPLVQSMIKSFLAIPTTVRSSDTMATPLDAMLQRIAQQNVAARVQPISTFQWASILYKFLGTSGGDAETFDDMLSKYNSHPIVLAHDRGESGAGSIALDGKKKFGVRNWIERCCPEAYQVVLSSLQDLPYLLGPFGETFAYTNMCFLTSKASLEANPDPNAVDGPLEGEGSVEVDWSLTMTPTAQTMFFQKVRAMFSRATVGIQPSQKKRYRLSQEDLIVQRNLAVLKAKLPGELGAELDSRFTSGTNLDADFLPFLQSRPQRIAVSMLPSYKVQAQRDAEEKQSLIHCEVQAQKEAVTTAQFKFFETALKQDQALISKVQTVPTTLKAKMHTKLVQQRQSQADAAQRAATGYQDSFLRVTSVAKSDLVMAEVTKMKSQASNAKIPPDEVALLGWCDFNAPWARTKENCLTLCKSIAAISESSPKLAATVVLLPDNPRDSNPRGLYDEERQLFDELYSLNQACEARFMECFGRESKRAEAKSNSRRWGAGRVITSSSMLSEKNWLDSELCVSGRPVGPNEMQEGAPIALLPKTAALLIPENSSPDAVRISDRLRPSAEQVSAQKGCKRLEMLLESVLRYTKFKAVPIINLTGYVEDLAVAVATLRTKSAPPAPDSGLAMPFDRLYYLSVHTLDNKEGVQYAKSRVTRELLDMWVDKKFSFACLSFNDSEPTLSDTEKSAIDAFKYYENPQSMDLQVLTQVGNEFRIHPDQQRQWTQLGGEYGAKFEELQKDHTDKFQNMLKNVLQSGSITVTVEEAAAAVAQGADGGGEDGSQSETMKSFETVMALEAADGPFLARCVSEVAGIEIIKGKSGQIYLLSDKDRIIAKNTLIGGFGTGKLPIQIDMQSLNADMTSFDIMSLYKYLTTVERQKRVTTHSVSYTEITRLSSSSGQDSFKVEPKNAHFYQTIPDSVLLRSFDRVHAVTKVQKPYCFAKRAISLEASKPCAMGSTGGQ